MLISERILTERILWAENYEFGNLSESFNSGVVILLKTILTFKSVFDLLPDCKYLAITN